MRALVATIAALAGTAAIGLALIVYASHRDVQVSYLLMSAGVALALGALYIDKD